MVCGGLWWIAVVCLLVIPQVRVFHVVFAGELNDIPPPPRTTTLDLSLHSRAGLNMGPQKSFSSRLTQ